MLQNLSNLYLTNRNQANPLTIFYHNTQDNKKPHNGKYYSKHIIFNSNMTYYPVTQHKNFPSTNSILSNPVNMTLQ